MSQLYLKGFQSMT